MYGIYANMWGILIGSMLAYIPYILQYMDPMGNLPRYRCCHVLPLSMSICIFVTWLEFHVFLTVAKTIVASFHQLGELPYFCQAATCCQEARDCNVGDPKVQKMVRSSMVPIPGLMDGSPIDPGLPSCQAFFLPGKIQMDDKEIREHRGVKIC